jgi:hypothetical protein
MKNSPELDDLLSFHFEENESVIRAVGVDYRNHTAIITEEMDKVQDIFKKYLEDGSLHVYNFDEANQCECCSTIQLEEDVSIDTETGEIICNECLSDC